MPRHAFVCAVLAFLLPHALPAQVLQLQAVADATADSSQPTVNFGSSPQLDLGKNFTYTPTFAVWFLRGHFQFDLTPVAGLGVPQRARLFWYQSSAGAAGCLPVDLFRVTASWSESTVTWANKPPHDAVPVASACIGDSFANGWKQFDVTSLVQGWLAGSYANHGMVVRDPSESQAGAARPGYGHSRESASVALRPYLELDFGTTFGAGCGPAGAAVQAFQSGAPSPGSSFVLRTGNLLAGSVPGAILGLSNTQWGTTPLPVSLAFAGFPGCSLAVAPDAVVAFGLLATSQFDLIWPVPNDVTLVGLTVFSQTFAFGPIGTFHLANGVGVTIH